MNVEGGHNAGGKIPRETVGARSNLSVGDAVTSPTSSPCDGAREAIVTAHEQGGKEIVQSDGWTAASQSQPDLRSKNHRSQPWQRTTIARGRKLQMTQAANGMPKTGGTSTPKATYESSALRVRFPSITPGPLNQDDFIKVTPND